MNGGIWLSDSGTKFVKYFVGLVIPGLGLMLLTEHIFNPGTSKIPSLVVYGIMLTIVSAYEAYTRRTIMSSCKFENEKTFLAVFRIAAGQLKRYHLVQETDGLLSYELKLPISRLTSWFNDTLTVELVENTAFITGPARDLKKLQKQLAKASLDYPFFTICFLNGE